ncbi:SMP-30/gluconolactonase/LRE family protein [Streptomyces sp. GESEQ-35]|uniref:SMP-30/gluconolactonase/LRE family protein n=1 Tax=Streptomyces sp. GESEQ-35 TaxID=2812657 RepID=UPI001B33F031|nr:superoxide dismutase [Streptomyces sp. GESEQ-35]
MPRNHPRPTRRAVLGGAALATLATAAGAGSANAASAAPASTWPTEFPLPNGFLPEGVTIGAKPYAYFGSRANGAVYRADLRTGEGTIVHAGETGTITNGLKVDHDGLLYLSSGSTGGAARIVDSRTGDLVTTYQLTDPTGHFINDVALLGDRAWFTDSYGAVLYGVPRGGAGDVRELPISGEWVQSAAGISANGLVPTPDGTGLIVVNGGKLYRVPLKTGEATEITLSGTTALTYGDGLLLVGHTLYVVQNRLNQVSVLDLDSHIGTATLSRTITDARLDVPTTAASYGNRLYLVNARFTSPQLPETTFTCVAVPLL